MKEIICTTNRILEIDLTTKEVGEFEVSEEDRRLYLGGKGLGLKYLYDRISPGIDPLGGENILALMMGVLLGTGAPCSGRFSAVTKSPLTDIFTASSCGGPFGMALKTAGYEGMLVSGRAPQPVFINVSADNVDFVDAADLMGMDTHETQEALDLKKTHGALVIGPAGENRVLFANIASGHRFLGRGGMGAVMGSKNLKAVVARGGAYKMVPAKPGKYEKVKKKATAYINANIVTSDLYRNYGTNAGTRFCHKSRVLPIRNFKQGSHEDAPGASGEAMQTRHKTRYSTCKPCTILCGHKGEFENGDIRQIPEYETVGLLGFSIGIFDSELISQFNEICCRSGMDTISAGGTLAWAMEAGEKGLFHSPLSFGSPEGVADTLEKMAHRKEHGDELANGVRYLSGKYGGREFAMHVKGLELSAYDPRGSWGQGLSYAVANRGGCHLSAYLIAMEVFFGLLNPRRTGAKPEFVRFFESVTCCINALHTCQFTMYAYILETPLTKYTPDFLLGMLMQHLPKLAITLTDFGLYTRLWSLSTGIPISNRAFFKAGDRIHVLERYMNTREGISRKDDILPPRLLKEGRADDEEGLTVPLDSMLDRYYRIRGYDKNGIPTDATLRKLGILPRITRAEKAGIKSREIRPGNRYLKRGYVGTMLWFVGRAIQAAARVDPEVRSEMERLPEGFTFALGVMPDGPAMFVGKDQSQRFRYLGWKQEGRKIDLFLKVKNIEAAFMLFTFQESTATAVAHDRLVVDGDLGSVCPVVRIIDMVEVYLLPRLLAQLAVKRYPSWSLGRKVWKRFLVYARTICGY